jgi:hypothetical protein
MFTVYLKQTPGTQFTFIDSRGGNSVFKKKQWLQMLAIPHSAKPKLRY